MRLEEAVEQGLITPEMDSPLAAVLAEEAASGLVEADNWTALLHAAESKPAITLDLGPAEDDLPLSPAAITLDLGEALDDDDLDLTGLPGLPTSGESPTPAEPVFTLDLGLDDDDDDFDLTGMPGLSSSGTAAPPEKEKAKGKGKSKPAAAKAAPPPTAADVDDDDFDLTGMPGLPTADTAAPPDAKIQAEIDAFWNALVSGDTSKSATSDGLSVDDALAKGVSLDEQLSKTIAGEVDDEEADAFWDTAVAKTAPTSLMKGMTLEEAQKQGLIPADLGSGS